MNEKILLETPKAAVKFELIPQGGDATANKPPTLVGYPIVFGVTSSDRGGYFARISPDGLDFDKDAVLALFNHDRGQVLGSTVNKTLRIAPDAYGVRVEIDPPDTTYARDATNLVRDGYISGMSFGMTPMSWTDADENGRKVRTYTKYVVDEFTITPSPAFTQAKVSAKYDAEHRDPTPARDRQSVKLEALRVWSLILD